MSAHRSQTDYTVYPPEGSSGGVWNVRRVRAARAKAKTMGVGSIIQKNRRRYFWSRVKDQVSDKEGKPFRYVKVFQITVDREWEWTGARFVRVAVSWVDETMIWTDRGEETES